jgi:hypothetical protein
MPRHSARAPPPFAIVASTGGVPTSGEITLGTHRVELGQSKPGVGYICVVPLDRYRPKALREVRAPVEAHAERIHSLCDVGNDEALAELKAILTGETVPQAGEVSA